MKKIGNRPITEADTDFSIKDVNQKLGKQNRILKFFAHTLAL